MSDRLDLSSGLAADGIAVTKSDATVYTPPLCGLYIGTAGDVVIKGRGGVAVTLKNMPSGSWVPINVTQVMAATTAADIVGLVAP